MSAMSYREDNKVLWRGVRPAHNGTQILESTVATNETVVLYTVSAGMTFNLCYYYLFLEKGIDGYGQLLITDELDVTKFRVGRLYSFPDNIGNVDSQAFYFPIEIKEGWKFKVTSSVALLEVWCGIHGFEE